MYYSYLSYLSFRFGIQKRERDRGNNVGKLHEEEYTLDMRFRYNKTDLRSIIPGAFIDKEGVLTG